MRQALGLVETRHHDGDVDFLAGLRCDRELLVFELHAAPLSAKAMAGDG
jgi:hypothetical protein